jgi:hypothetical protein
LGRFLTNSAHFYFIHLPRGPSTKGERRQHDPTRQMPSPLDSSGSHWNVGPARHPRARVSSLTRGPRWSAAEPYSSSFAARIARARSWRAPQIPLQARGPIANGHKMGVARPLPSPPLRPRANTCNQANLHYRRVNREDRDPPPG